MRVKIRNYLSHYSGKAQRALRELYKNKYSMAAGLSMDRFLEPGQFLLAYKAERLWIYFDAFEGASNDIRCRTPKFLALWPRLTNLDPKPGVRAGPKRFKWQNLPV